MLAHAEGGGVLYVDSSADADKADDADRGRASTASACATGSTCCSSTRIAVTGSATSSRSCDALGIEPAARRGPASSSLVAGSTSARATSGRTTPSGSRASRSTSSTASSRPREIANRATSALAAGIVAEDAEAVDAFFDGYRGTAVFWHAPTRFADGFALTGAPETGINVGWAPGPRGPVTYRDLWLRQFRVVGDGTQQR